MTKEQKSELALLRERVPQPRRDIEYRKMPLSDLERDDLLRIFTILVERAEERLGQTNVLKPE